MKPESEGLGFFFHLVEIYGKIRKITIGWKFRLAPNVLFFLSDSFIVRFLIHTNEETLYGLFQDNKHYILKKGGVIWQKG
jgi:hypothetical protein